MHTPHMTASQARNLAILCTADDDGAHAADLIELIEGVTDSYNEAGTAALSYLRTLPRSGCACATGDGESHCEASQSLSEAPSGPLALEC